MEILMITDVFWLLFHLEGMIDVESFRIRSVVEITQEWYQITEVFMEYLNNSNIIADIQNFTALLNSKEIFFRYNPLRLLNARSQ